MGKNPINVAFGKAVALRRDELQLTQADLAALVGISRASVANIEKGRQNVLLHHAYDLAAALKMPKVGDLLPARPKPALDGQFDVVISEGSVSPRNLSQVSEVMASALASVEARKTGS